jgi:hypothetical protein
MFKALGFINQKVDTWSEFSTWIYKLNFGILSLFFKFCGTQDIESREIRNEGRKMTERVLVDYRNGHLLAMHYLGTVRYSQLCGPV